MSQQQRTQNLYGVQDWDTIYQTFRDADFKSYDYETLRKSMLDFLRIYNPENFNDYINSSEYLTLVDLMAFMGQALSFRVDLNARENFLQTARRTDNITRLARLINYEVKRNLPAQGLLKIDSVRTDEELRDTAGFNLTGANVRWNDSSNPRWQDQWNTILNAALGSSQRVGNPGNTQQVDGIETSSYALNLAPNTVPVFPFSAQVDNITMQFEAVNPVLSQGTIQEASPDVRTLFNLLWREDGRGFASNNTGYFLKFKQGTLLSESFRITESLPNRTVDLASTGINQTDVWLLQQKSATELISWQRTDTVANSTVSYTQKRADKLNYAVITRAADAATLLFGDGVFSEIPVGDFICYYRQSNGLNYRISPAELGTVIISIPYQSRTGRVQQLTLVASLRYTVANSSARENLSDVRIRAPQNYYVQNRMVNGQDYNSLPFARYSNLLKIKSVNRTSSGVSRYLDVVDPTGRYSSTNIVCDDGVLYRNDDLLRTEFTVDTQDDIANFLNTALAPAVSSQTLRNFFYDNYQALEPQLDTSWQLVLRDNDVCSGYVHNTADVLQLVTTADSRFAQRFRVGAVLEFAPPAGQVFDAQNQLVPGSEQALQLNQSHRIYATVRSISQLGRGTQVGSTISTLGRDTTGAGAVVLSSQVPSGARLLRIWPTFAPQVPASVQLELIQSLSREETVALGYRAGSDNTDATGVWFLITDPASANSAFTEPVTAQPEPADASWLLRFQLISSGVYEMQQRSVRYYFGSLRQTRFFHDARARVYDPASGKLLTDRIDVLKTNSQPGVSVNLGFARDISLGIAGTVVQPDGFVDDTQILVAPLDSDADGAPDQPVFFTQLVGAAEPKTADNLVFFSNTGVNGAELLAPDQVITVPDVSILNSRIFEYAPNAVIFDISTGDFYRIQRTPDSAQAVPVTNYSSATGRYGLRFHYRHNAPSDRRIDPSPSNIIDVYVLEKNYADDYAAWIQDNTAQLPEPVPPTTESLRNDFADLEQFRMISDLIIYNPAQFKPLFGQRAEPELRCKFVVVRNSQQLVSDSEIRTQLVTQINRYFDPENWDFGETFYFSELAAHLHTQLGNIINSVHLVPLSAGQTYGDLQQIRCLPFEIPISVATVQDIEVVSNLTGAALRAGF